MKGARFRSAIGRCVAALLVGSLTVCAEVDSSSRQDSDRVGGTERFSKLPDLVFRGQYGCVSCDGPELLDIIQSLGVGSDRSFVLLNRSPPLVRVFGGTSDALASFGMRGQGPGELASPVDVAVFHDSVLVADYRGPLSAIEIFNRSGTHVGRIPIPVSLRGEFSSSPSGRWLIWAWPFFAESTLRILRINTVTAAIDTIAIPAQLSSFATNANGLADAAVAVSDEGLVALGIGQVAYGLAVFSADGVLLELGERSIERRPRSQRTIEEYRRRFPDSDLDVSHAPHFLGSDVLQFDSHNRLWVKTNRAGVDRTVFDVFAPDLTYLGEVSVEERLSTFGIGPGTLVGSTREAVTSVPVVKVWDIREQP